METIVQFHFLAHASLNVDQGTTRHKVICIRVGVGEGAASAF